MYIYIYILKVYALFEMRARPHKYFNPPCWLHVNLNDILKTAQPLKYEIAAQHCLKLI